MLRITSITHRSIRDNLEHAQMAGRETDSLMYQSSSVVCCGTNFIGIEVSAVQHPIAPMSATGPMVQSLEYLKST